MCVPQGISPRKSTPDFLFFSDASSAPWPRNGLGTPPRTSFVEYTEPSLTVFPGTRSSCEPLQRTQDSLCIESGYSSFGEDCLSQPRCSDAELQGMTCTNRTPNRAPGG